MNVPLVVTSCGFHGGDLPAAMSLLAVEDENVRLVAMKESQDGAGIVLRLVEVEGKETEARVTLASELLPAGATAVEVDTLERSLEAGDGVNVASTRLEGNVLTVRLPAFGITTVRIG